MLDLVGRGPIAGLPSEAATDLVARDWVDLADVSRGWEGIAVVAVEVVEADDLGRVDEDAFGARSIAALLSRGTYC